MKNEQRDNETSLPSRGHLPSTKEVLCEHIHAVVQSKVPELSHKVTGMLTDCPIKMLTAMLENENLMDEHIERAVNALKRAGQNVGVPLSEEKQKIGDDLFGKVAEIESELCAQITGMLLEMDMACINRLLSDPAYLEAKVATARIEYLREHHPSTLPTKEELGEEIYEIVSVSHPEEASKITGMLLELDLDELQRLVDNLEHLKARVEQAWNVMKSTKK